MIRLRRRPIRRVLPRLVLLGQAVLLVACDGSPSVPPLTTEPSATISTSPEPTTFAPPSPEPHHRTRTGLLVIGDFGSGTPAEFAVSAAMEAWSRERRVDAILTTGDNVYERGDPSSFEEAWLEPFGWVEDAGLRVFAALGNHDVKTDDGRPVIDLFDLPGRWYAQRVGPIDLVVLDSNHEDDPAQAAFLETVLAASEAPWLVVAFHHPMYSCGPHDPAERSEIRAAWEDLLDRYDVDLVLTGHDHNYQRFAAIRDVRHILTGGGGADLYRTPACTSEVVPEVRDRAHHHFVYLSVSPQELEVTAVAASGEIVDHVVLTPG